MDTSKRNQSGEAGSGRKAYQHPRLKTYGNIREITQTLGHSGNPDGASSRPKKTALP